MVSTTQSVELTADVLVTISISRRDAPSTLPAPWKTVKYLRQETAVTSCTRSIAVFRVDDLRILRTLRTLTAAFRGYVLRINPDSRYYGVCQCCGYSLYFKYFGVLYYRYYKQYRKHYWQYFVRWYKYTMIRVLAVPKYSQYAQYTRSMKYTWTTYLCTVSIISRPLFRKNHSQMVLRVGVGAIYFRWEQPSKKFRTPIGGYLMRTPSWFCLGYTVPHSIPSRPNQRPINVESFRTQYPSQANQ